MTHSWEVDGLSLPSSEFDFGLLRQTSGFVESLNRQEENQNFPFPREAAIRGLRTPPA